MKNAIWFVSGLGAVAAYLLYRQSNRTVALPVEVLAHRLEAAWADHRTVA